MKADIIIVGAGLAGIYTALMLPERFNILILSKGDITSTNSYLAQGGIAASMRRDYDSPDNHYEDTLICGHYKNNPEAVRVLVEDANFNMHKLEELGVYFDKNSDGSYLMGMEGAHRVPRILRIGDHTGRSVMESLFLHVEKRKNITWIKDYFLTELLIENGKCFGVLGMLDGKFQGAYAENTVLATGGIGHLYSYTSNASGIDGSGISSAIKSGVKTSAMNLTQFHPTVFYTERLEGKQFLISEAVRGEGARLLNISGQRFMEKYDNRLELAPRDVVSSAIEREIFIQGKPYVYLDITHKTKEFLTNRFPTIYEYCSQQGLFMERDYIPVSPRMHYFMGGISTDLNGRTSVEKLFAVGECAYTGVHGQNRLASNSLLEAVVFGNRIAKEIERMDRDEEKIIQVYSNQSQKISKYKIELETLKVWMDDVMGINREYGKMQSLFNKVQELIDSPISVKDVDLEDIKIYNALLMMREMLKDALNEVNCNDSI